MKKFIYSLVLCAIAAIPAFAQETLTVFDGEATNGKVPVYGFYADAYNKVEMIMPADDLSEMTGATISKMTWYLASPADAAWGGNYQVYLMEVAEAAPTAYADLTNATLVWEGPLDGTGATIELEFANDFSYEGGNLLIAVHQTETGTYKSATFAGKEVTGATIQGYSYSNLDAVSMATHDFLPKTTFEYTPSSGVVYYKPKNLQASEITPNGAKITWTPGGTETTWAVEYKKAADETWTPTDPATVSSPEVTLDGLDRGTKYDIRVKSIYADGESNWSTLSFVTLMCEASDMGEVAYVLTDTYGDGWNGGGKLQILIAGTDIVVEEIVLPNGTGNSMLEGTVMLCYGVDYDLNWVGGTYTYENGFVLTAPDGSEIYNFQGTGSSSGPTLTPGTLTTFQISQVSCPRPSNVEVSEITYNSAKVTWTPGNEEQDLFEVIYGKGEFAPEAIDMVPVQVNEPSYPLTELEENATYTVYVRSKCTEEDVSNWTKAVTFETPLRFPLPEEITVDEITAKSAKAYWEGQTETYNLRYREVAGMSTSFEDDEFTGAGWMVYDTEGDGWGLMPIADYTMGGVPLFAADGTTCLSSCSIDDNNAYVGGDNWIMTEMVTLSGTLKFYAADLGADYAESFSVYVAVGEGTDISDYQLLAEGLSTPGAVPSSADAWQAYEFDLSAFEGQTGRVAIVHNRTGSSGYYLFIDNISIVDEGAAEIEWTTMPEVSNSAIMQPLKPLTKYEVQVQGIYPDGTSQWTESVYFTTLAADAMPTNVEITAIDATTATVNVEGSQETYNIRYRTAAGGFLEDFEGIAANGDPAPEGWTTIDADGDGNNWFAWFPSQAGVDETDNQGNPTVIDHVCMTSASYTNVAITPDNWLITPLVDLGGTFSMQYRGQDPSYAAEHFAVYVSTTGTEIDDFVELVGETVAGTTYQELTADLSEYEGEQGYIAIRHYNVSDMFRLNIDNVSIVKEGQEAGEWVTVENVTVPYVLEGLDPETKYEVQVQGVVDDGAKAVTTTDWTRSVFFTTLADEGMNEFYVVGTFNDWNQEANGGRIAFDENFEATVDLEADAEFKIITPNEDGGWIWYGGRDDNQVGFFLINNDLLGVAIDLIDGANFRVAEKGNYTLKLETKRGLTEPLVMTVTKNITGIDNINVDNNNSKDWYNLNGQKLNGKPTTPGIYINGNKKVIIK